MTPSSPSLPSSLAARLSDILSSHIGTTCTTAVLRLEVDGHSPLRLAVGHFDENPSSPPASHNTPFDLASLTKVFTATAALRLTARGAITLDTPIAHHLPAFSGDGREKVTLAHLLTHTSGLPSLLRFYGPAAPAVPPYDAILSMPLQRPPGDSVEYSDVGFMLLGRLVETIVNTPLPDAIRQLVAEPLSLSTVRFGPVPGAPASEWDTWRGRRLQGEVHDENASVLGGAAGHAGLFGSARDVAVLARAFASPDPAFLPPDLAREATREQARTGHERRGYGWKMASRAPEASESSLSSTTFGHYGFTGTAVWHDTERRATIVLLTNRVYFGRDPSGIAALRRSVFQAVADAVSV